jgi:hypothetical protein
MPIRASPAIAPARSRSLQENPHRNGRQRSEQLARRLEGDQAPEQIAASCRQMIDVYVTAAGAKLPSSTRRRGKVFR